MYKKSIRYDREMRDYAMYLDGELVGFARTYHEAEITLDQLVFELMSELHTNNAPTFEVAPPPIDPPTTCCFCHGLHHPQRCPEMRALLFAPDVSIYAPSLNQAIALGLVGTPDPTCKLCGSPAFIWIDHEMYCKSWWEAGECDIGSDEWTSDGYNNAYQYTGTFADEREVECDNAPVIHQRDLIYPPLDVDFAPIGPEV